MSPEKAINMLMEYKMSVGRCEYLKALIQKLRKDEIYLIAHAAELIAMSGGGGMDGMPHGTTVGNPTEKKGMQLAGQAESAELKSIREEIRAAEDELRHREFITTFVDAWLCGLKEKEKWLVESIYFEQMTYRQIVPKYEERYGEHCSKDNLRRLKKKALDKIADFAR